MSERRNWKLPLVTLIVNSLPEREDFIPVIEFDHATECVVSKDLLNEAELILCHAYDIQTFDAHQLEAYNKRATWVFDKLREALK